MAKKDYVQSVCIGKLERKGCKFSGMRTFTVPKGRLGIKSLGLVDYLQNYCGMMPVFSSN